MKLGAGFTLYTGEELLLEAIKGVRDMVDFICVVYQEQSHNRKHTKDLSKTLSEIKPYVDYIYLYTPNSDYSIWKNVKIEGENEIFDHQHNDMSKRQLCMDICRANGCDWYLALDTDEFYVKDEFNNALQRIVSGGYDSSFCQMQTYYKYSDCVLVPSEEYYVPFVLKLDRKTKVEPIYVEDHPVKVDGARCVKSMNPLIFPRPELQMHHFSYVRKDCDSLLEKLKTSMISHLLTPERLQHIKDDFNNFIIGQDVAWAIDKTFGTKKIKPVITSKFQSK